MNKIKQLWQKFGILIVVACGGLIPSEYIWNPDLAVAMKVASIISIFLMVTSLALDDRDNKGLFPKYNEEKMLQKASEDAIASAIVIATKNLLLATILYLAVTFAR